MGYRAGFGLLTLLALSNQIGYLTGKGVFHPDTHFAYFTNLTNLLVSLMLLIGAYYLAIERDPTLTEELVRGTATLAMATMGVVFAVSLSGFDVGNLQPWVNVVLHYIMPLAVVIDWLLLPPKAPLRLSQLGYCLIYPLAYLAFSLIRGAMIGFYPYAFMNPSLVGPAYGGQSGYAGVATFCLLILLAFLLLGGMLSIVGNRLPRHM
jgi:hypothetical protein